MRQSIRIALFAASVGAVAAIAGLMPHAVAQQPAPPNQKDGPSMNHARGPFTVKIMPQGEGHSADDVSTGRVTLDKAYSGDLQAIGVGDMLAARTAVGNSAGYVAIERVTGTLDGRSGSFVVQHSGTMDRGAQQLAIGIVPDSGTGELAGIAGMMSIDVAPNGAHHYDLAYTIPAQD